MNSQVPEAEIDRGKQMESSVWGFDPVTEFDSGNPSEQMEANSLKKQRSALASSEYPAKSFQSSELPLQDVSSAIHSQESETWATRSTDRLATKSEQKEDDPVLRSATNLSMKSAAVEGSICRALLPVCVCEWQKDPVGKRRLFRRDRSERLGRFFTSRKESHPDRSHVGSVL
jgi:hypothetical protein